jgi:hypothetical protein
MNLFFGVGRCDVCHGGTELTSASVAAAAFVTNIANGLIDQMPVASGQDTIYDTGFNDTSVRPITDDIGRGGNSPFTNPLTTQAIPLSYSAQSEIQRAGNLPFETAFMPPQLPVNFPVSNNGAFKVPGLRNVELTAPYFHDGGTMTLEDVVDFYTRGGNFPAANINHLDFNITQNGAMQNQPAKMAAIVAFLKSLTDERVRNQSAPFDHPEIFIPNLDPNIITPDVMARIPAKDAFGNAAQIALTIDPLPGRTNKASQLVQGSVAFDAGAVTVSLNGGAPINALVTATTDTMVNNWSAMISGFTGGANTITATAGTVVLTASLSFIPSDGKLGAAGPVGVMDAVKALRIAIGLETATADDMIHGDVAPLVNGVPAPDNRIDVSDAMLILKKAVGLVSF